MKTSTATLHELISDLGRRHDTFTVFSDFVAMAAIAISNAVDMGNATAREADYLAIVKRYSPDELAIFPKALGLVTLALEEDMADVLGDLFHELDLGNKWKGQFFTPDHVCRLMAGMTFGEDSKFIIEQHGFIRACEPCVGSGAMVIALARHMRETGINYQQTLHVTAVDVDIRAVHMAYIQLSLLHVPAVIVHGNTLTLEEYSQWATPAHILGFWKHRLALRGASEPVTPLSSAENVPTVNLPKGQLELF